MKRLIIIASGLIKKRLILISLSILLLTVGTLGFNINQQNKPQQVTEVKKQDIKSSVSTSGQINGFHNASLKFKSSGKLTYIGVSTGDQVKKNQLLANLDLSDLSIDLQMAKNNLRDKQAIFDKTIDDIHLFQYGNGGFTNVGSPNETQTQRMQRTSTEVAKDNAVDNLKAAQVAFDSAIIFSPFDGTVVESNFLPNQIVSSADTVIRVVDWSKIYFDAEVDESDIGKISLNQRAEVTLNSYNDKIFNGLVTEIAPQTKITTTGSTIVIVRIELVNPPIGLISGLSGQANIITSENKEALVIPQESVRDSNIVLLTTDNGFKAVKVTTGIQSDSEIEIKNGLNEKDIILKNPAGFIEKNGSNLFNLFRGQKN